MRTVVFRRLLCLSWLLWLMLPLRAQVADPAGTLYDAIESGELPVAVDAIRALYAEAGIELPPMMKVVEQSPFAPLSAYQGGHLIRMSGFLKEGQGYRYWENWSDLMSGGAWQVRKVFRSEADARRLGNFTLAGILAHEMGHYICDLYRFDRKGEAFEELLADELTVRMMNRWAQFKPLKKLRKQYLKHITIGLHDAVPDSLRQDIGPIGPDSLRAWCAALGRIYDMPVSSYVSLQIARQRVLLETRELNGLEAWFRTEMAAQPGRKWYRETIALETVAAGSVPRWMRTERMPDSLWGLKVADFEAAVRKIDPRAGALPDTSEAARVRWQMTGPQEALLFCLDGKRLMDQPARLYRFRFDAASGLEAELLAAGDFQPVIQTVIVPDPEAPELLTGLDGSWYRAERGGFSEAEWHGKRPGFLLPDGPVGETPMPWFRNVLKWGDRYLCSNNRELKVLEDGRYFSLAGGIPGYRDSSDPSQARFFRLSLLGIENGWLYMRTASTEGVLYRRLRLEGP